VYLVALYKLLPSLQNIASSYSSIKSNLQALKNVLPILLEKNEMASQIKNEHKIKKIEISKLNFSFGEKKIFMDCNISLEKGKIIGIIGKTGVGKTTFLDLICGFIKPDKVEIKINDNKTFNSFDDCNLKKDIGLVTQKPLILNDTVIKNISFDLKRKSNNIDLNDLKEMCSLDFIENLTDKWDTVIGEKNTKLSSGQMQRLSIARTLYYDREILLLDEPTNNLDNITEKKIINNLEKIKSEKIILLISHNLDNLEICDKIYEFKNHKLQIYEK
jgi:ABC-type bacteriocin/lantibiotic exporter with double-glycine peptidase domain